jgi:hypothetical protein
MVDLSGDRLSSQATGETVGEGPDERLAPLVGEPTAAPGPDPVEDVVTESLRAAIEESVEGDVSVDEGLVTRSLDEILIGLVALSDDQTHGTVLMEELAGRFDADLSPGTVYPRLHDLDDQGVLDVHELVQTKQYGLNNREDGRARVEAAMNQHLAIGAFLAGALDAF